MNATTKPTSATTDQEEAEAVEGALGGYNDLELLQGLFARQAKRAHAANDPKLGWEAIQYEVDRRVSNASGSELALRAEQIGFVFNEKNELLGIYNWKY